MLDRQAATTLPRRGSVLDHAPKSSQGGQGLYARATTPCPYFVLGFFFLFPLEISLFSFTSIQLDLIFTPQCNNHQRAPVSTESLPTAFQGFQLTQPPTPGLSDPGSRYNTQGNPFLGLPVQSPKPEVLAPDTSCSNVALRWGKETEADSAQSPLHPAWHGGRGEARNSLIMGCQTRPHVSPFPIPGSWFEEDAGAVGGPSAVRILAADTVPRIEHVTATQGTTCFSAVADTVRPGGLDYVLSDFHT